MKLSIILPVYNDAAGARRALQSVGKLPFDHELLLADDGSDPVCAAALSQLKTEYPALRLLSLPHGGVGAAREAALQTAQGDFILFCDSDDCFYPAAIPAAVTYGEKTGADVVFFGYGYARGRRTAAYLPPEEGVFSREEFGPRLSAFAEADHLGQVWGKLFSRSLFIGHGLHFSSVPWGEDRILLHQALARAERFAASHLLLYRYAPTENGLCRRYLTEKPVLAEEVYRSLSALFHSFHRPRAETAPLCRKSLLKALLSHAASLYSEGAPPRRERKAEALILLEAARQSPPSSHSADGTLRLLEWVFRRKSTLPLLLLGALSHLLRARLPDVFYRAAHGKHRSKTNKERIK